MMEAVLKGVSSPDIDLATFKPDDPQKFGFLLEATIGPAGQEGGELFQLEVYTPEWIEEHSAQRACIWGRHVLIVFRYDLDEILRSLNEKIAECAGTDWHSTAVRLSRYLGWEFEDYSA